MKMEFESFREASIYASDFCRRHSITARVERSGSVWIVIPAEKIEDVESRERELREQAEIKRNEDKRAKREAEHQRKLDGWKSYCQSASTLELTKMWDDRNWGDFTPEEEEILRSIINARLGISL